MAQKLSTGLKIISAHFITIYSLYAFDEAGRFWSGKSFNS